MTLRVFVPGDMAAVAVGADAVAAALRSEATRLGVPLEIVRNGSRGAFELEPLVEVETGAGRIGYARVNAGMVPGLVAAGLFEGVQGHAACIGRPEDLPFFRRQTRLTFARCGLIDQLPLGPEGVSGSAPAGPGSVTLIFSLRSSAIFSTSRDFCTRYGISVITTTQGPRAPSSCFHLARTRNEPRPVM